MKSYQLLGILALTSLSTLPVACITSRQHDADPELTNLGRSFCNEVTLSFQKNSRRLRHCQVNEAKRVDSERAQLQYEIEIEEGPKSDPLLQTQLGVTVLKKTEAGWQVESAQNETSKYLFETPLVIQPGPVSQ